MRDIPVKEGDLLTLTCASTGSKGDGVCFVQKYAVFVHELKVGEKRRIRIIRAGDKFGFGEVVNCAHKRVSLADGYAACLDCGMLMGD